MKKGENKMSGGLIAVLVAMGIVVVVIAGLLLFILNSGKTSTLKGETSTADATLTDSSDMFEKYGNFKDFTSISTIIPNTMPDADKATIRSEIMDYWFMLIQYGDYSDAYTFIATDIINQAGVNYTYEDFVVTCTQWATILEDEPKNLKIKVLDGVTPNSPPYGNLHMAVIYTGDEISEGQTVIYLPFYVMENGQLIPFDVTEQPASQKYGIAAEPVVENTTPVVPEDTGTEAVTDETTENIPEDTATATATETVVNEN